MHTNFISFNYNKTAMAKQIVQLSIPEYLLNFNNLTLELLTLLYIFLYGHLSNYRKKSTENHVFS